MKRRPERTRATPVRVQRYLSQAGVASRRQAEGLVAAGRISVNGARVERQGVRVTPGVDVVALDDVAVEPAPTRWVVFHKPSGTLCTRSDPHGGTTVFDALPDWARALRYVGRLDRDTSGLLLLTNEGDLAARLAHPSGRVEREYRARVSGDVTARSLRALKAGVRLEDGLARPRRVRRVRLEGDDAWGVRLVLVEGRKRQVRRMLEAVGHPVEALARTRFGPFRLGALKPGRWRPAGDSELARARALSAAAAKRASAPRGRRGRRSRA